MKLTDIALSVVILMSCGCINKEDTSGTKSDSQQIQTEANELSLKVLDGTDHVKLSDFKGTPVFIDFWATWCPPCRAAVPLVEKLYKKYKDRVQFVGINLDQNLSEAEKFIKKNSILYLQLKGLGSEIQKQFGVRGIPAFFILDKDGLIEKKYVGYSPNHYNDWVEILEDLLKR